MAPSAVCALLGLIMAAAANFSGVHAQKSKYKSFDFNIYFSS